ncbi:MAG: hypothetical protein ACMG6E_04220 [Candidatus Roizmanbacteria bacterium]
MNISNLVNSFGLIFDIVGVILLWKFGLPESIDRNGQIHLILEQTDISEDAKAKKYDFYSKIAIAFLIAGFILQLASNFIPLG